MAETRQANRGRAAEELVRLANEDYRRRDIATVVKVPTEWLPIRGQRNGRWGIVSAKVDKPAAVDFIGVWRGRGIAFDVKEWSGGRFPLSRVEPHQVAFLADWHTAGGLAFVLLVERQTLIGRVLSWRDYVRAAFRWARGEGPRSFSVEQIRALPECPSRPGNPCDYLAVLDADAAVGQEGKGA